MLFLLNNLIALQAHTPSSTLQWSTKWIDRVLSAFLNVCTYAKRTFRGPIIFGVYI